MVRTGYGAASGLPPRFVLVRGDLFVLPAGQRVASEGTTAMTYLLESLRARIVTRDHGATAVEYGLLVALIAAVIAAVVLVLGKQVSNAFQSVSDQI